MQEVLANLCPHFPGRDEGKGERGMGEGKSERRDGREERNQNTVQLTHLPAGPPRSPAGV